MVCACVDIGTNTTRALVADVAGGALSELLQDKAFTRIGRAAGPGEAIPGAKVAEVARVVAGQVALARGAGAERVRVVATAAIRAAPNRDAFVAAVAAAAGVAVAVLDGEEEGRLAFLGATRTLGQELPGRIGVVDVGGGSTELVVGTAAEGVRWCASVPVGSGLLAERDLRSDPPTAAELERARGHAADALATLAPPPVDTAVAVGGSAASLRRLVGEVLDSGSLERALGVLAGAPAEPLARELGLEPERVRLLPAGILVLGAAAERLGRPLLIGCGGLREGVLLDMEQGR